MVINGTGLILLGKQGAGKSYSARLCFKRVFKFLSATPPYTWLLYSICYILLSPIMVFITWSCFLQVSTYAPPTFAPEK